MSHESSPVAQLLLVRLLVPAKKKLTRGDLKKSLDPLFQHRHSAAEWNTLLDETLNQLAAGGLVIVQPPDLTDTGRQKALSFLGLDALPPRTTWKALKDSYLVGRALGLPPDEKARKHLGKVDNLRALVLKQHHDLATAPLPTATQVLDALAWKQLDVSDGRKFTRDAVLMHCLGVEGKPDAQQLRARLAAQAAGARNTRTDELRLAVLRQWLDAACGLAGAAEPQAVEPPFNLAAFAQGTLDAARSSPTGHFGEHKVFIHHVWRQLQQMGVFPALTESEFKQRLTEANQAGLLVLSRADLVEAMNPEDVRASETSYLNATFHFLQV